MALSGPVFLTWDLRACINFEASHVLAFALFPIRDSAVFFDLCNQVFTNLTRDDEIHIVNSLLIVLNAPIKVGIIWQTYVLESLSNAKQSKVSMAVVQDAEKR